MAYKITDICVACGTCIDECPVGAISEGDIYKIHTEQKKRGVCIGRPLSFLYPLTPSGVSSKYHTPIISYNGRSWLGVGRELIGGYQLVSSWSKTRKGRNDKILKFSSLYFFHTVWFFIRIFADQKNGKTFL